MTDFCNQVLILTLSSIFINQVLIDTIHLRNTQMCKKIRAYNNAGFLRSPHCVTHGSAISELKNSTQQTSWVLKLIGCSSLELRNHHKMSRHSNRRKQR